MPADKRAPGDAREITTALLRSWPLPIPRGGKEDRGTVLVIGGSEEIPGAVMLAALGALRAGAGKIQIGTSRKVATAVAVAVPEARVIGLATGAKGELERSSAATLRDEIKEADAVLIGPGMADAAALAPLLQKASHVIGGGPLIADAAALELFGRARKPFIKAFSKGVVLTPHAGEMAKLCGLEREQVEKQSLEIVREAAARLGVIIALKGSTTYIASPEGKIFKNEAGNAGLGTSGSGDTLSGVIAGLCARGADALQATVWGVRLHALAGDTLARELGPLGFLARELLAGIPPLLADFGHGPPSKARAKPSPKRTKPNRSG